jgi:NADPH:quinone reductase-like Zn-dependent oxidoreductase
MKAAVRERYGPPEVVVVREVERPTAVADEVLVRVHVASVNRADLDNLYPRWAFIRLFEGVRRPRTPRMGLDVAGVVEAVGPAVTRFRPGDRVYGDLYQYGLGAFAEYACAPERAFGMVPEDMPMETAATLPHSAVLAIQSLRLRGGRTVRPGDRVLVDGASGNVGPFAVQIAKALGAEVTAVCSAGKMGLVRGLGADHVIDYGEMDVTASGQRFDWIVGIEARHSLLRYHRALRPGGAYVALGASATWLFVNALLIGPLLSRLGDRWLGLLYWWRPFSPDDVATLERLVAEDRVRPVVDRTYPLTALVDALRRVDRGEALGKVVVTVAAEESNGRSG